MRCGVVRCPVPRCTGPLVSGPRSSIVDRSEWMRVTMSRAGVRRSLLAALSALAVVAVADPARADDGGVSDAPILGFWEVQSLNGVNSNPDFPTAGSAGARYLR